MLLGLRTFLEAASHGRGAHHVHGRGGDHLDGGDVGDVAGRAGREVVEVGGCVGAGAEGASRLGSSVLIAVPWHADRPGPTAASPAAQGLVREAEILSHPLPPSWSAAPAGRRWPGPGHRDGSSVPGALRASLVDDPVGTDHRGLRRATADGGLSRRQAAPVRDDRSSTSASPASTSGSASRRSGSSAPPASRSASSASRTPCGWPRRPTSTSSRSHPTSARPSASSWTSASSSTRPT